jgi:hypothetical protein
MGKNVEQDPKQSAITQFFSPAGQSMKNVSHCQPKKQHNLNGCHWEKQE